MQKLPDKPVRRRDTSVSAYVAEEDVQVVRQSKSVHFLVKLFLALILVSSLIIFATRLMEYNELQNKKEQLNKDISDCQDEINRLEHDIAAPMDDEYIIKIAREKLGLHFPDEIIFFNDTNGNK